MIDKNIVRQEFNKTEQYTRGNTSIRARVRIIRNLLDQNKYRNIIDLGCGNGEIGISLVDSTEKLFLVDISEQMIAEVQLRVNDSIKHKVEFEVSNILDFEKHEKFELVLCIGVMAHIDSISELVAKIVDLLDENGYACIQFTEKNTLMGWLLYQIYGKAFHAYKVNQTSITILKPILHKHGLKIINRKIYSEGTFGIGKISKNLGVKFKILTSKLPMLSFFFSERIILVQKIAK